MRVEPLRVIRVVHLDWTKHRMGDERGKTVIRLFQCDLENLIVYCARTERRVHNCRLPGGLFVGLRWRLCSVRSCRAFDV